jgi:hypothetical protein
VWWHKERIGVVSMAKKQWSRLIHTLEKYNQESERLETEHGYKTPPVKTIGVRTTKRAADLIDDLIRGG